MDFLLNISYYWTKEADPRVLDWPLINSAYHVPLIIFAYLYFVLGCGPRFMKNRPPYSLKTFIQLYDIVQIVANVWLVYDFLEAGLMTRKLFYPIEVDYTNSPTAMRSIRCAWSFFVLKLLDYVETVIFVLRKKNNQVSGLHLYHHVSTLLIAWLSIRYCCMTPTVFIYIVNSTVHAIMYVYYFLAVYGPDIQQIIAPMKRWITIIQMMQFVILILYVMQNFIDKIVPNYVALIAIQNLLMNFFLFYNFYKKMYTPTHTHTKFNKKIQ